MERERRRIYVIECLPACQPAVNIIMSSFLRPRYNNLMSYLYSTFAPEKENDEDSVVMGTECLRMGLHAIYFGTNGDTRSVLDKKHFPEVYAFQPSSSSSSSSSSTAAVVLLSRQDIGDPKQLFVDQVKEKCTKLFLYSSIPRNIVDTEEKRIKYANTINDWIEMESRGNLQSIMSYEDVNLYVESRPMKLVIVTQFIGSWEHPFADGTEKSKFYLSDSETEVDMMNNTSCIDALVNIDMEKKLNATVVKFPYRDDFGAMVVIMPNEPADSNKLFDIFQNLELETLFNSFKSVECYSQSMPKFSTTTKIPLNKRMALCDDLREFVDDMADYSNIFEGRSHYQIIDFTLQTTIENTEYGTEVIAKLSMDTSDGCIPGRNICIDKPFLYFIVNSENYIFSVGMFFGDRINK